MCSASLSGLAFAPANLPLFHIPSFLRSFLQASLIQPSMHLPSAVHPWALLTKNWDLKVSQESKGVHQGGEPAFQQHTLSVPQRSQFINQHS